MGTLPVSSASGQSFSQQSTITETDQEILIVDVGSVRMDRRGYLSGVGAGIGTAVAGAGIGLGVSGTKPVGAESHSAGDRALERRSPDETVAVRPGSRVLFETEPVTDPLTVEWTVDEESFGHVEEFFAIVSAYERPAIAPRFETEGTVEVRARDLDGDGVSWTVDVSPDGAGSPSVEELSVDPERDGRAVPDGAITHEAVVRGDGDPVDRVIWFEPGNALVVGESAPDGASEAATFEVTAEEAYWIERGYDTAAYPVSESGVVGRPSSVSGPGVGQPFDVDILETNAPVAAGELLTIEARVTSLGSMYAGTDSHDVALVVGGDVLDSQPVELAMADSTTVELAFETYPVQIDVDFPVRVETETHADETSVEVFVDDS